MGGEGEGLPRLEITSGYALANVVQETLWYRPMVLQYRIAIVHCLPVEFSVSLHKVAD